MNWEEKKGEVYYYGQVLDFKIDTNRRVYGKHKEDNRYTHIDWQVPLGLSDIQKAKHLQLVEEGWMKRNGISTDGENQNENSE